MKKRDVELKLIGEQQKAVWSLMWSRKKMRSSEIAKKIGRTQSAVCKILNFLIEEKAIEYDDGVYSVSDEVKV